jgi:hypothetical protein
MAGAVCYEEQDFVGETVRDLFDTVILAARSPPHPLPNPRIRCMLEGRWHFIGIELDAEIATKSESFGGKANSRSL